jgi:hypothetical protein
MSHRRLVKKTHLLRSARSPRSNVSVNTPPLVDFSRASHLDLFEQPGSRVFHQSVSDALASKPLPWLAIIASKLSTGVFTSMARTRLSLTGDYR